MSYAYNKTLYPFLQKLCERCSMKTSTVQVYMKDEGKKLQKRIMAKFRPLCDQYNSL